MPPPRVVRCNSRSELLNVSVFSAKEAWAGIAAAIAAGDAVAAGSGVADASGAADAIGDALPAVIDGCGSRWRASQISRALRPSTHSVKDIQSVRSINSASG